MAELQAILVALAAGMLVGVERGWRQRDVADGHRVAGVRTFALIGLFGGLNALLAQRWGVGVLVVAAAGLWIALHAGYVATVWMHRMMGLTTLVAAASTFAVGALAGGGELEIAATAAIGIVLVLQFKAPLHGIIGKLSSDELAAGSQLLLISVVILPLLPDRGFGPYEAINPYRFWWAVVLLAALSLAAYVAMKTLEARRGLLVTALLGGMVSSTATTAAMARIATTQPALNRAASTGATFACAAMFARMIAVIAVAAPPLLPALWPVLAAMALSGIITGLIAQRRHSIESTLEPALGNPLSLGSALGFAALLSVLALLSRALTAQWGEAGLFITSALAGLADVDAIIVTTGRLVAENGVAEDAAALALLLGTGVNQLSKLSLAAVLGGRAMLLPLLGAYAVMALAGFAAGWLVAF